MRDVRNELELSLTDDLQNIKTSDSFELVTQMKKTTTISRKNQIFIDFIRKFSFISRLIYHLCFANEIASIVTRTIVPGNDISVLK